MKKIVLIGAALCVLVSAGVVTVAEARTGRGGRTASAPRLYEPGETVRPSAGAAVKFRWSGDGIPGDTHRYDEFRLFRGNQAYADAMVHDAEVPPGQGWIQIPAEFVAEPGVYCWTVKRVGVNGRSREAFSVFKTEAAS